MAQQQADDSDLRTYMTPTLREEALRLDVNGRPVMCRRAIRYGFVVSTVFYGVLLCVAGGGFWVVRHFL
jgi:hypothetical protein